VVEESAVRDRSEALVEFQEVGVGVGSAALVGGVEASECA
jgi:hypothetical protein